MPRHHAGSARRLSATTMLGLSATPAEAVAYCAAKLRGERELARISFLNIGVGSDDTVPPELPGLLRDAGLAATVHLIDINMVRPIELQRAELDRVLAAAEPLDPMWLQEDLGLWRWGNFDLLAHMLNPILDEPTLAVAAANARAIMQRSGRLFLAENAPAHFSVEDMDLLSFLGRLSDESGCGLIIDVGHLIGYCLVTGRDPCAYVAGWDHADRVLEVHMSGYDLLPTAGAPLWRDDHARPLPPAALVVLRALLDRIGRAPAITLEQEGAPDHVVDGNVVAVAEAAA